MTIVYDIETCPLPLASLNDRQVRRLEMEGGRIAERERGLTIEQAARKAGGLHAHIGWVCCVSVATVSQGGEIDDVASFTAAAPDHEAEAIGAFWDHVSYDGPKYAVTFNGKWFDAPFLRVRSMKHQIRVPSAARCVLDTHRWQNRPHLDLAHVVHPVSMGLADLCDVLDVPSPKGGIDGSRVSHAVEQGRIAEVARYCERDVVATAHCARALSDLGLIR